MSDEYEHKLEAKSDIVSDTSSVGTPGIDAVPEAEIPDQELYHSHSWWTTYVFSRCEIHWSTICFNGSRNWTSRFSAVLVNANSTRLAWFRLA